MSEHTRSSRNSGSVDRPILLFNLRDCHELSYHTEKRMHQMHVMQALLHMVIQSTISQVDGDFASRRKWKVPRAVLWLHFNIRALIFLNSKSEKRNFQSAIAILDSDKCNVTIYDGETWSAKGSVATDCRLQSKRKWNPYLSSVQRAESFRAIVYYNEQISGMLEIVALCSCACLACLWCALAFEVWVLFFFFFLNQHFLSVLPWISRLLVNFAERRTNAVADGVLRYAILASGDGRSANVLNASLDKEIHRVKNPAPVYVRLGKIKKKK